MQTYPTLPLNYNPDCDYGYSGVSSANSSGVSTSSVGDGDCAYDDPNPAGLIANINKLTGILGLDWAKQEFLHEQNALQGKTLTIDLISYLNLYGASPQNIDFANWAVNSIISNPNLNTTLTPWLERLVLIKNLTLSTSELTYINTHSSEIQAIASLYNEDGNITESNIVAGGILEYLINADANSHSTSGSNLSALKIDPIRGAATSAVNFNEQTMGWGDLFAIWMFELGSYSYINNVPTVNITDNANIITGSNLSNPQINAFKNLSSVIDLRNAIRSDLNQGMIQVNSTDSRYFFIGDKEFYVVKKDKKYGFINKKGIEVIPLIYDEAAFNITEDLIAVKKENKWGFVNRKNETEIPFMYDAAYPFFNRLAFVKKENLYQVIDTDNKIKFISEKSDFPFYSNNLSISKKEGKYGYMDKTGKIIVPAIYDYAYPFVNELAYVELNGRSGFINKKGKEIIPAVYKQLWPVSDNLIRFVE